ncbi:hypothetical protein ECEC1845_1297 [Escherichia coli EC1845]|uniref:Uncharacterized protein n=2 Tax=Escherichia coli O157:H7 TaxID=83334 RepID=Q8X466_ECO57|nr:hypothetical protein Z1517 [Escherichia coli O157:H7 str. EDL933]ACT71034.1 predicted protein [Escherichia coli O157:H7 str. TW14359]ADD55848.1 hypothetical protein G2583_1250 [Escherichia coli O55:H7 str. CB9615]AIF92757.1 hypothetical protein SS17_1173 [Escherichia coli O157:H7 str. SS17]AJA25143.1 hypothetical protein SS52_1254 [Escherichia coli O157:H7 str. SS52]ASL60343.1 hypothetical protein FORC44_3590 [Escherichia coli]EDU34305.1 conserved hypothetical protein [Escherichia coli O15
MLVFLVIDFHDDLLLLVKISIFIMCDFINAHPASFYRDLELYVALAIK